MIGRIYSILLNDSELFPAYIFSNSLVKRRISSVSKKYFSIISIHYQNFTLNQRHLNDPLYPAIKIPRIDHPRYTHRYTRVISSIHLPTPLFISINTRTALLFPPLEGESSDLDDTPKERKRERKGGEKRRRSKLRRNDGTMKER